MRPIRTAACVVLASLVYCASALAQINGPLKGPQSTPSAPTATVPRLIQVKGSVHDEAGKPLSGNVGISFTLYKDANDQVAVWQENQNVRLDSAGHYSVLLGATNEAGLPLEIFSAGEARWLGVRPDGQAEQPRILFLSVAYALKAADTEMLGGKPASAFVLADSLYPSTQLAAGAQANAANVQSGAKIPTVGSGAGPLLVTPAESNCSGGVNSNAVASPGTIALFTDPCDVDGSVISQTSGIVGIAGELLLPPTAPATSSSVFNSQPLDLQASAWNGTSAVTEDFQWMGEPTGNGTLNLRFGAGTTPAETGLSIASTGVITFATGQAFPIPNGGVTNSMLLNPYVTVATGAGLSGGGQVQLGGTITLTNTSPSSGGTITSVGQSVNGGSSSGIFAVTASPVTDSGTLNINISGTSGGLGYFSSSTTLSSSGAGIAHGVWLAEGPGNAPSTTGAGTSGYPLVSDGPTADPSYAQLASAGLNITPTSCTNQVVTAINSGALGTCSNVSNAMLASSSLSVNPAIGGGLIGGGLVNLGGSTTLGLLTSCSANQVLQWNGSAWACAANGSGGTVTNVATGTGLTGGPISSVGTLSLDTSYTNAHYLQLAGGTLTGGLTGTSAAFSGTLNVSGTAFIGSTTGGGLNALGGAVFPPLGTAAPSTGYPSSPLDLEASTYFLNSGPQTYFFRWQAGAVGNDSSTVNPGASLNLLYGVPGFVIPVLSVAGNGIVNFASGQTYPGLFATNPQTSLYTTTSADFATCATIPVASGTFNITLVASSSQPANGQCIMIINYGSGAVTIAPNGQHLNGLPSNLTLNPGSATTPNGAFIVSDGTNYVAQLFGGGGGSGGSGTVTSVAQTINSGSSSGIFSVTGSPVTISGALNINLSGSSGGIPYFSSNKVLSSSATLTGIVRGGSPPTASEISGDAATSGSNALTVKGLNGTLLSNLATGLLKNTTSTGVPSIATSSDIVGLFTGCSGTLFLGADGKCHAASGSGTVTSITATSPLTGGTITTTGTVGLMSCSSAGQILIWSGTSWGCGISGGGGGVSGTMNGIGYFSGPTTLTSTPAPTNGQILIGSTGIAPVLGTLTAGANVSITNGPGSITISASGGGGGAARSCHSLRPAASAPEPIKVRSKMLISSGDSSCPTALPLPK